MKIDINVEPLDILKNIDQVKYNPINRGFFDISGKLLAAFVFLCGVVYLFPNIAFYAILALFFIVFYFRVGNMKQIKNIDKMNVGFEKSSNWEKWKVLYSLTDYKTYNITLINILSIAVIAYLFYKTNPLYGKIYLVSALCGLWLTEINFRLVRSKLEEIKKYLKS